MQAAEPNAQGVLGWSESVTQSGSRTNSRAMNDLPEDTLLAKQTPGRGFKLAPFNSHMPLCISRLPGSLSTSFRKFLITPIVVMTVIITITAIIITMTVITAISATSQPSTPASVPAATLCAGVKLLKQHFLPGDR